MDFDIDQELLEAFQQDCQEHIEALENKLVEIEGLGPTGIPADAMNSIYRSLHSIKGAAKGVGFIVVEKLGHAFEEAIDYFRQNQGQEPSRLLYDAFFEAAELIGAALGEVPVMRTELHANEQKALSALLDNTPGNNANTSGGADAADFATDSDNFAGEAAAEATNEAESAAPAALNDSQLAFVVESQELLGQALSDLGELAADPGQDAKVGGAGLAVQIVGSSAEEMGFADLAGTTGALGDYLDVMRAGFAELDSDEVQRRAGLCRDLVGLLARAYGSKDPGSGIRAVPPAELQAALGALDKPIDEGDSAAAASTEVPPFAPDAQETTAESHKKPHVAPSATQEAQPVQSGPSAVVKDAAEKSGMSFEMRSLRVDVTKLDELMDLLGELVIGKIRLEHRISDLVQGTGRLVNEVDAFGEMMRGQSSQMVATTSADGPAAPSMSLLYTGVTAAAAAHEEISEDVNASMIQLDQLVTMLRERALNIRMVPIRSLFQRFPRVVRNLGRTLEKQINFVVSGEETEVDKGIVEALADPLIHLIRNAADHGLEPADERLAAGKEEVGTIHLSASQEGNQIVVRITDDGGGLNQDKLKAKGVDNGLITAEEAAELDQQQAFNLIFAAGFSTASSVTGVSGRGVGMDVVRDSIAKLKGTIGVDSVLGEGTTFSIKLPLTLAILNALHVRIGEHFFAVPLSNVIETIRLPESAIKIAGNQETFFLRGHTEGLVRLDEILRLKSEFDNSEFMPETTSKILPIVLVGHEDRRLGLLVDDIIGRREMVVKTLGALLGGIRYLAGGTILGDGKVVPILEVGQIVDDVTRSGPDTRAAAKRA